MIGNCCFDVIDIWWSPLRGMMPWSTSCSRVRLCWSLNCSTENRREIKCLRSVFDGATAEPSFSIISAIQRWTSSCTCIWDHKLTDFLAESKIPSMRLSCPPVEAAKELQTLNHQAVSHHLHLPLLSQSPFELFRPTEHYQTVIFTFNRSASNQVRGSYCCRHNVKVHYVFICVACVQNWNLFDVLKTLVA